MFRFLRYAALRSLYPLAALAGVWGVLLWGPWLSFPLALLALHLVPYLESLTGPSPADLVTAPALFGRLLRHREDIHSLLFCGLCFLGTSSAFWLWLHPEVSGLATRRARLGFALGAGTWIGWAGGINMGVNFHSHAHQPVFRNTALNRWLGRL